MFLLSPKSWTLWKELSTLQKGFINVVSWESQWEYCSNLQPVFMFYLNARSAYPRDKTYFLVDIMTHFFFLSC